MPPHFQEEETAKETIQDVKTILSAYDHDSDGKLSQEEIDRINRDLKALHMSSSSHTTKNTTVHQDGHERFSSLSKEDREKVIKALEVIKSKYDSDGSGVLEKHEIAQLDTDITNTQFALRYCGYLGALARSARYFRVLFKSIVAAYLIKGSYALAFSYITLDLAFEAYSAKRKHPDATNGEMAHMLAKRGGFQLTASIVAPMYTLQAVSKAAKVFIDRAWSGTHTMRAARIQQYGPSLSALATVPLLPFIWDKPISLVFDAVFGDPFKRLRRPHAVNKS